MKRKHSGNIVIHHFWCENTWWHHLIWFFVQISQTKWNEADQTRRRSHLIALHTHTPLPPASWHARLQGWTFWWIAAEQCSCTWRFVWIVHVASCSRTATNIQLNANTCRHRSFVRHLGSDSPVPRWWMSRHRTHRTFSDPSLLQYPP